MSSWQAACLHSVLFYFGSMTFWLPNISRVFILVPERNSFNAAHITRSLFTAQPRLYKSIL